MGKVTRQADRSLRVFFALLCTAAAGQTTAEGVAKQPKLYVVGYAHLDTEWRWEYPQVISEFLPKTMLGNFALIDKYPHYIFNFSGANRYRFMRDYYPEDFAKLKQYVAAGRWFPAGSSMEEGDVNTPSAESIIRQVLYGNEWFRREFGKASAEYMLPDCFGFPASLPTILAHSGVKGFSTQKLVWGSSAPGGGPESLEKTPEGTPFNVGVWVGPDGESVLAALNPGAYNGDIDSDLSKPLPALPPDPALEKLAKEIQPLGDKLKTEQQSGQRLDENELARYFALRNQQQALLQFQQKQEFQRFQGDWAARVENNGKVTGTAADYHYFGTGDVGGAPREDSVRILEETITKSEAKLPPQGTPFFERDHPNSNWPEVKVGDGPVHVISSAADQMFLDLTPADAEKLPRYTGEMELTNHSAGSLTSQAYQKRWLRKEELLADAAEKASVTAAWLSARQYPQQRLNDAWTLVMGGQFHDLAAGTATPKAYEFAWNDDVIAMNQFAGILKNATEGVSEALDTKVKGIPVVVYNPLNVAREDIVEATLQFPAGVSDRVRVTAPGGKAVPAQVSNGKVLFLAHVPPVGYAVYDVELGGTAPEQAQDLRVTDHSLENQRYRVQLNSDGDVSSIFDKSLNKEMLASPARLAISYDNPRQWPAWNMDWDQEQAQPKMYVSGPAQMKIVENGPARVAIRVSRETAGSKFIQTILLSAGEAGKRVEFANDIDWDTRESNLKATFPLAASNNLATYNWDIGTIERPTAEPKKFEVPSHQWIDLTDASGEFGATVLSGTKNGSDKPNDHTIRLTLIRTPGIRGGYPDQATQDIGHHEFVYGFAAHAADWRQGQTDWQGEELNAPLVGFQTAKHAGSLGREFSLLQVNSSRIHVLAVKRAEHSDEVIVRMVEMDGWPKSEVRVTFAEGIAAAREVNGQEQPIGPATVHDGVLVTSFGAYQPRTFALKLRRPTTAAKAVRTAPVALTYDVATASTHGSTVAQGFDGNGNALAAEMLPQELRFDDVPFRLGPTESGQANAVIAKGQTINLPSGDWSRVYVIAASSDGDQTASFQTGERRVDLRIEDWTGFVGQWDDRIWKSKEENLPSARGEAARTEIDPYSEMIGLQPGYIKRADLAWYCNFHHDAKGENMPYRYSYLFGYAIELPHGTRTVTLPNNGKIRIMAMSVAEAGPEVTPVQPLYDTLGQSEAPVQSK